MLIEDYIEAQSQFVRDLDQELERFARKLGDSAAVVKPFTGDIDAVRSQVLDKNWTESELLEVRNTPGLLMINQDFDYGLVSVVLDIHEREEDNEIHFWVINDG